MHLIGEGTNCSFNSFADSSGVLEWPAGSGPRPRPFNSFADSSGAVRGCDVFLPPVLSIPLRIRVLNRQTYLASRGPFNSFADSRNSFRSGSAATWPRGSFQFLCGFERGGGHGVRRFNIVLSIPLRIRDPYTHIHTQGRAPGFQFLCGFE